METSGTFDRARVFLLLAALVAVGFVVCMLQATNGRVAPQNVDLFVVCRYAQAMAEGHPFHYNPGEPISSGATSLLHTALLALAHLAGLRSEGLVGFAIATGALCFLVSVAIARRLASSLSTPREGALAAALLALSGPVVWGFLYGSDVALFMLLCLALMESLLASWSAPSGTSFAVLGSLLVLTRPEGLPIVILAASGWSLARLRQDPLKKAASFWAPTVLGGACVVASRLATGEWVSSSVSDKSLFSNYGFLDAAALSVQYAVDVTRGLLMGFYPSEAGVGLSRGWAPTFFPPLGLVLVLFAFAGRRTEHRQPLNTWAAVLLGTSALLIPNLFMGVQFNRYLLWMLPGLLVLVAVGLSDFTHMVARDDPAREARLFRIAGGLLVALGALSTVRFAAMYGELAGSVEARDVAAARWIRANLPKGVSMANIVTSVEYLTGHRNLNLHGVTSPAFFGNRAAEREAGVWESLGDLPEHDRPDYLITSAESQEGYPTMREVVDGPPLFATASLSDDILIYRTRWDLLGRSRMLFRPEVLKAVSGLREVDRLNVCDSRDERVHSYAFRSTLEGVPVWGEPRIDSYTLEDARREKVVDSGRVILGEEEFQVRAEAGRDLVLVLRTASSAKAGVRRASGNTVMTMDLKQQQLFVELDGARGGGLSFSPQEGWDEVLVRIPGDLLRGSHPRLRVEGRYASFYYWFFQ